MDDFKNKQKHNKVKQVNQLQRLIFKLLVLLIIVAAAFIGSYLLPSVMTRFGDAGVDTLDKTVAVLNKHFSSKENFAATFGPIISEQKLHRLQFYQRNQVCLFRIVRYMGHDSKNYNYTEFYKKESDKKLLTKLPILLNQYCEWLAKGSYEFNFYIDMSDLAKWNFHWEPERSILTLYPPPIKANTPAELEPLVFTCISDSVTIDETYTKQQLANAIPELKKRLAEDQKQFMYEEAKDSIKNLYRQFLLNLIPTSAHNNAFPEIVVKFRTKVLTYEKSDSRFR